MRQNEQTAVPAASLDDLRGSDLIVSACAPEKRLELLIAERRWHPTHPRKRAYRRGFTHGLSYACELIFELKRKGFVRPAEIGNIIYNFNAETCYRWRYNSIQDTINGKDQDHPHLKQEAWLEIRQRIFERDGLCCIECGSPDNLECHHIEAVNEGGLPTDDNLQTLCSECHKAQ